MKKNLTNKGSNRLKPEGLFFATKEDRKASILRSKFRWLVDWEGKYFCDQFGNIYSSCQNAIRLKSQHKNTSGYLRWTVSGGNSLWWLGRYYELGSASAQQNLNAAT